MKTLEEYVLKQLEEAQNEVKRLKLENDELRRQLDTNDQPKESISEEASNEDKKIVYLVKDKPNYFYSVSILSSFNYEKVLDYNKLTPAYLEKVLSGEEDFEAFCNLYSGDSMSGYVGEVRQCTYDFLITNYYGKSGAISSDYEKRPYMYNIDESYGNFLSDAEARANRDKRVRNTLKDFFKYGYDQKWYEKQEKKKLEEEGKNEK